MKDRYLFLCNGVAALVRIEPGTTSKEWADIQNRFARQAGEKDPENSFVSCSQLHQDQRHDNVYWTEWIQSHRGANFCLHPMRGASSKQIECCRQHLKRTRDVVNIQVSKPRKWITFEFRPEKPDRNQNQKYE